MDSSVSFCYPSLKEPSVRGYDVLWLYLCEKTLESASACYQLHKLDDEICVLCFVPCSTGSAGIGLLRCRCEVVKACADTRGWYDYCWISVTLLPSEPQDLNIKDFSPCQRFTHSHLCSFAFLSIYFFSDFFLRASDNWCCGCCRYHITCLPSYHRLRGYSATASP